MKCAWQELLSILPSWLKNQIDKYGAEALQELRLRVGKPAELVLNRGQMHLSGAITADDLRFVVNTASQYSPWARDTISQGFLTAPGGHRIGICGDAVIKDGNMTGIRTPSSLCIRIARDFPGIGKGTEVYPGSVLILGKPGSGKTTLLRDLIRYRAKTSCVAVVDERGELFPVYKGAYCFDTGAHTDILTGCSKIQGIDTVLRTMGPGCIAVDEITCEADCVALSQAIWCGVDLLATAHAASMKDLRNRPIYAPLVNSGIFQYALIMNTDKSWRAERITSWVTV